MKKSNFLFLLIALFIASCSSPHFKKNPLDDIIKGYTNVQNFSIILHDMDYHEDKDSYVHQYQVLIDEKDTVTSQVTDWKEVSESFFKQHQNNMGMVIASKVNGSLKKAAAPPGYNNYIGNEKYGRWENRNGNSFWEFYGKYAFLSSMFRMGTYPVRYSYWNNYRTNYYGMGRPYYGPNINGSTMYGTRSVYNKSYNKKSKWNSRPGSFKKKVRQRVSRSSFYKNKKSRSSSRYGSSYRSRSSSSFGK